MKLLKSFLSSSLSVACLIGLATPSYAGTCIETSPGITKCWSSNGGSSTTIETSPGVYNYYGTDSKGNSTRETYIQW
ncbi:MULTISPECIES: hypothetical protein [Prochlorococcus]|uniref:hypothetical protein n=1 Tax=Prochlorococcus TaxID=1218 RepID=UPI001268D356|nr:MULTISPECIES: hypothetical protein [Prochlorococcus]